MSFEAGLSVHDVVVLAEHTTQSPTSPASRKSWAVVNTVPGRAVMVGGGQRALDFYQRGFKTPWVVMFEADPGITPAVNRLRFVERGVSHDLDLKAFRPVVDADGGVRYYVAEGDEITQRPTPGPATP